jgi:hypothetical protein
MIEVAKLEKVNPSNVNLKTILPKNKGIYFWCLNDTDEVVYIGTGSGKKGLYNRIVGQHLNPKQIEYRAKVHHKEKDAFQLKHPVIRERDGAPGVDQSVFRRSIGRAYNIRPGAGTVNYIKDNFYLKYLEIEDKDELMVLEKELIHKYQPVLNICHKYKISNRL